MHWTADSLVSATEKLTLSSLTQISDVWLTYFSEMETYYELIFVMGRASNTVWAGWSYGHCKENIRVRIVATRTTHDPNILYMEILATM